MELLKNFVKNNEEDISIEEQIELLKENISDKNKINGILFKNISLSDTIKIDNHVFNDLEFFEANDGHDTSVAKILGNNTITSYGKYTIYHLLKHPLTNITTIKDRQWILKYLNKDSKINQKIKNILQTIENADDIFWLWKETDQQTQTLYDMVYFSTPFIGNIINNSEFILRANCLYKMFLTPFFTVAMPILCFIIPFVFLRYMGLRVSFMQIFNLLRSKIFSVNFISNKTTSMAVLSFIIWFSLYVYNAYTIINMSILTNNITNILHDKLRLASQIVNVSKELKSILSEIPETIKKTICYPECDDETEKILLKPTILQTCSVFRNKGCILSSYWKMKKLLQDLSERIRFIGFVDSYYGLTSYLKSLEKHKLPWTYVEFGKNRKYEKFWHPNILSNQKKPVPNSLKVDKNTNTLIITGPNAAGKSTYIKTIFTNSLLAQLFGFAFAKKWKVKKPYEYIDTYFNVPDVEGKASTFQAEMKRCYSFIKNMERLSKDKKDTALIALDEIFTSTNYKEGISGAYSIIKYISDKYPNILCLVTTHYHTLAELQERTNEKIVNYCLDIKRDNNVIKNTFKVKKGVSKEHVALDLLEKEGFSNEIIKIAREIYNNIDEPIVRLTTK